MTKSTITRERAQQIFLGNGPEPSASEERELARMALAAMDSESVGTLSVRHMSYSGKKIGNQFGFVHSDAAMTIAEGDYPLYRHVQPASVAVPDEMPEELLKPLLIKWDEYEFSRLIAQDIWNACRAAMLNGGKP